MGLATVLACVVAIPAQALADDTGADISACSQHQLSQPFMGNQDFNWYAYAPGMSSAGFDPAGWVLNGGASVVQTKLANGLTGGVLNLPTGATAVSPAMCVSSGYQLSRAQIRTLTADSGGGVALSVSSMGAGGWSTPVRVGNFATNDSAWGLSGTVKLQPAATSGWQLVRFTLTSATSGKGFQLRSLAAQVSTELALPPWTPRLAPSPSSPSV